MQLWDFWIDGVRHEVPHQIIAQFKFQGDLIKNMTASLERANLALSVLYRPAAPANERWTVGRKQALLNAIECGLVSREWALVHFDLTEEELDAWRGGRLHLKAVHGRER